MNIAVRTDDRFVKVDGLGIRYIEEGTGVPTILLHGSSLGSSADVFRRNLTALGTHGIRAIAVDLPGFGKSDPLPEPGASAGRSFILHVMDALGLKRAALIGHSSAGSTVVSIALEHPERVSHVMILGTGSLLPPLETSGGKVGGREEAAQARLEERMVKSEPTIEDTRALLEANLFHHELITPEELDAASAMRHLGRIRCPVAVAWSVGDSPEFRRQARVFAAALEGMGRLASRSEVFSPNHFEEPRQLADPDSALSTALYGLMKI